MERSREISKYSMPNLSYQPKEPKQIKKLRKF